MLRSWGRMFMLTVAAGLVFANLAMASQQVAGPPTFASESERALARWGLGPTKIELLSRGSGKGSEVVTSLRYTSLAHEEVLKRRDRQEGSKGL